MDNGHTCSPPLPPDVERARQIVMRYGWNSASYQVLNPGLTLWFSNTHDAVVAYVVRSGYRVIAGAPVCDEQVLHTVVQEFEHDAHAQRHRTCYFCAGKRLASYIALDRPANYIQLGAEPFWNPRTLSGILNSKTSLRAQLARARNKIVTVSLWENRRAMNSSKLKFCLANWLQTRGLPPLHFLIESQTLERLCDRKVFVAEQAGEVVAFTVASPIPNRNAWLIEQNVRSPRAPNGTVELLLAAVADQLSESGADLVTLGLAPLSQRAGIEPRYPFWLRFILNRLREQGRRFYNFDGLDTFKAKFLPEYWDPIYAITSQEGIDWRTLYAIAGAFAGMSPLRLAGIVLLRTAGIEKNMRRHDNLAHQ